MKFDEFNRQMRAIETEHDRHVPPGIYMIVRMDGHGFTRLTKETHKFEVPFDERFRDYMVETTAHLMNCGFRVVYGYTQSDEISLLFHPDEGSYGRNIRKYTSILAGEASSKFSLLLGDQAVFDARVCEWSTIELLVDYFRWRAEDAHRNALNAHCYWALRTQGLGAQAAAKRLERMSATSMNEFLKQAKNRRFSDLPAWQRRGIGLYWEDVKTPAVNPKTGERVMAIRRRVKRDYDLPAKDAYATFIRQRIQDTALVS